MSFAAVSPGLRLEPGHLDPARQEALVAEVRRVVAEAPFFTPRMPRTGKPFSVMMTNCGPLGWVSDVDGYRYQPTHPDTGRPWPAMPAIVSELWQELADYPHPPEACLVNYYATGARMGLHRDADEEDFDAPVLSVSLGDSCVFRIGGPNRKDPTRSFNLASGDVLLLAQSARLSFHGVDRTIAGSSTLLTNWLPQGGRINLTLRRVTRTRHG